MTLSTEREYDRVHYAARKLIAAVCERCGGQPVQAALRIDTPPERLRVDGRPGTAYSTDPTDYTALCVPCHRFLDLVLLRPRCRHGHLYVAGNVSYRSNGARRCLECHREDERRRMARPGARDAKLVRDRNRPPLTPTQRERKTELQRRRRAGSEVQWQPR